MKQLLICISLFCSTFTFGLTWGVLDDFVDTTVRGQVRYPYLIEHVLENKPIRVYVYNAAGVDFAFDSQTREAKMVEGEALAVDEDLAQTSYKVLMEGYNRWFQNAAQAIRRAQREQEFADILPVLERGVHVELVPSPTQADLRLVWLPNKRAVRFLCGSSACYRRTSSRQTLPDVVVPHKKWWRPHATQRVVTHELGHSLGLADQYLPYQDNPGRNNADPRYSTVESGDSIMNHNTGLTCDDADGIINLMDIARRKVRGGAVGWRSFCKKPGYQYVQGTPVDKGPYFISAAQRGANRPRELTVWTPTEEITHSLEAAQQGDYPLLENLPERVQERDAAGRVLKAIGRNAEEIYYMYSYDSTRRLVVKNGTWLAEEHILYTRRGNLFRKQYKPFRRFVEFLHANVRYAVLVQIQGKELVILVNQLDEQGHVTLEGELHISPQGTILYDSGGKQKKVQQNQSFPFAVLQQQVQQGADQARAEKTWRELVPKLVQFALSSNF